MSRYARFVRSPLRFLSFLSAALLLAALAVGCSGDSPTSPSPVEESLAGSDVFSSDPAPVEDIDPSGLFDSGDERTLVLEARPGVVPPGGGSVELIAQVTRGGEAEGGVPVVFETSAGRLKPDASGTTGAAGRVSRTLTTNLAAIVTAKIQVAGVTVLTSDPVRIEVGTLSGGDAVELTAETRSRRPEAGRAEALRVTARRDGAPVSGLLKVEFGDGREMTLSSFTGDATVDHTWRQASVFQVRLVLTEPDGVAHARTVPVKIEKPAANALKMAVRSRRVPAREPVAIQLRPELRGKAAPAGMVLIDWGDGRQQRVEDISKPTWIEHIYREKGSYPILAKIEDGKGKRSRARARLRITERLKITGSLTVSDANPVVDTPVRFVFSVSRNDGHKVEGTAKVSFGDGSSDTMNVSGSRTFSHTFGRTGTFKVEVELTDEAGRTARGVQGVTVRSAPTGGGGGDDGGGGGGGGGGGSDAINPGSIRWLHANPSSWSVTSQITNVSISGGQICLGHTKAGGWPVVSGVEGNPWIIANVGGQWYGGTYEWLRPGQTCKNITAGTIGPHVKASPLSSWRPRSGEVVYFMVSTPGRAGVATINQRSNIVRAVWP